MRNNDLYINQRASSTDAGNKAPMQSEPATGAITYPEIYYILQPHVLMECDNMEMNGTKMTQGALEAMCDRVYETACRIHPELVQYDMESDPAVRAFAMPNPPIGYPDGYRRYDHRPPGYGFDINDLIRIMLINEILKRRRRRYY